MSTNLHLNSPDGRFELYQTPTDVTWKCVALPQNQIRDAYVDWLLSLYGPNGKYTKRKGRTEPNVTEHIKLLDEFLKTPGWKWVAW